MAAYVQIPTLMSSSHRRRARNVVLVVAALLIAGWLIPPFFHAGRYRKALRSSLESRLGRPVKLGAVSLRLLPHPGFSIQNVLIEEDPRFGSEPLARVDEMECDLGWRNIWGSRPNCWRIVLSHPVLNAVRDASGEWNLESFVHPGGAHPNAARETRRLPPRPLDIEVDHGRINFTVDSLKKPFALDGVEAHVQFSPAAGLVQFRVQATPVRTDVTMQPPGPFVFAGEWKPAPGLNGPFQAHLTTQGALISGWFPLLLKWDPGIYGVVNASLRMTGSIHRIHTTGTVDISQLHLLDSLPPSSPMPMSITMDTEWDRDRRVVQIQNVSATISSSRLRMTGEVDRSKRQTSLDVAVTIRQARLQDLVALANRLAKHPTNIGVSGSVNGDVAIRGPWSQRQYSGEVTVRSLDLRSHGVEAAAPEATLMLAGDVARLEPTHVRFNGGIEGSVQGRVALPGGSGSAAPGASVRFADYEGVLTVPRAPLASCVRLARLLRPGRFRDVDARGWASGVIRLTGRAWPFSHPSVEAEGDLSSARLLIAGLTEPVLISRFHATLKHGTIYAFPVSATVGQTTFTGWLRHSRTPGAPWTFDTRTRELDLDQASLWFSALGYRRPMPILDLIPGLRSLAMRVVAGRNVFAAVNAQGRFECPTLKFHALTFKNVRAGVTIAGRTARISNAGFDAARGNGRASAEVDFKQSPASIAAKFEIAGMRLSRFATRLPPALSGIRGVISAVGHVTTRGLTRPEMAAHLAGTMEVQLRNVSLGAFDPLAAIGRAASLRDFAVPREEAPTLLPPLRAMLRITHSSIRLAPLRALIGDAPVDLSGAFDFNGHVDLAVRADLRGTTRRWQSGGGQPARGAPPCCLARLRLTGSLRHLAVTPVTETALSKH